MPATDFGSEKVADLAASSEAVKSRRTISVPPLSKAKTESDESVFSHASAEAVASKNARVSASSVSEMQIREPSVSMGVGAIGSLSLLQAVKSAAATATAAKRCFFMILKGF